jgi:hypothetical protein
MTFPALAEQDLRADSVRELIEAPGRMARCRCPR